MNLIRFAHGNVLPILMLLRNKVVSNKCVYMFRNKPLPDNKFEESQLCIPLNILLYELSMKTDDSNCFSLYFISAHLLLFSSREHSSRINVVILAFVYYNWLVFFLSITYPCYFDRKLENNRSNAIFSVLNFSFCYFWIWNFSLVYIWVPKNTRFLPRFLFRIL